MSSSAAGNGNDQELRQSQTKVRKSTQELVDEGMDELLSHVPEGAVVLALGFEAASISPLVTRTHPFTIDVIVFDDSPLGERDTSVRNVIQVDSGVLQLPEEIEVNHFDFILLPNTLGRLAYQQDLLVSLKTRLTTHGHILLLERNASYAGVVWGLLNGSSGHSPDGNATPIPIRPAVHDIERICDLAGLDVKIASTVTVPIQHSEFSDLNFAALTGEQIALLDTIPLGSAYWICWIASPRSRGKSLSNPQHPMQASSPEVPQVIPPLHTRATLYGSSDVDAFDASSEIGSELWLIGAGFNRLNFLWHDRVRYLRFDPSDIEGTVCIHRMLLRDSEGSVLWAYDPLVEPHRWNRSVDVEYASPITVTEPLRCTITSRDPQIYLVVEPELVEKGVELEVVLSWLPSDAQNDSSSRQAGSLYNDITAGLGGELGRLSRIANLALRERDDSRRELRDIRESHSWRVTAPVRLGSRIMKQGITSVLSSQVSDSAARLSQHLGRLDLVSRLLARASQLSPNMANGLSPLESSYQDWLNRYRTLQDDDIAHLRRVMTELTKPPLVSIVVPVFRPELDHFRATVDSVFSQLYENWELCICDDASNDPEITEFLRATSLQDPRVKVMTRESNGGIVAATNDALTLATGDFIAFLDHDDLLAPEALALVAREIDANPDVAVVYSDEDKIDSDGNRFSPYFKGEFDPLLLLGQNYFNHFTAIKTSLVREVGGLREEFSGSQDWDLLLRAVERIERHQVRHIPWILYHWRVVPSSVASSIDAKPYAVQAGGRAVRDALVRRGIDANAELVRSTGHAQLAFKNRDLGKVSIVIPTRDRADLLRSCIDSLQATTYPNFDITVIDNGSTEADSLSYFRHLEATGVQVARYDRPFNFAAMHNWIVPRLAGQYICLMNNDIEVVSPEWLTEMVNLAQLDHVGAVGAQLLYPDNTIQHAGVLLGIGGVAGHAHKYLRFGEGGYVGKAHLAQEFSAVTGACLLVSRANWDRVGGMDDRLRVAFNDVDFCLKLFEAGFKNVYSSRSVLVHHESKSRGSDMTAERRTEFATEIAFMQWKWGEVLTHDPYLSPCFSRSSEHPLVDADNGIPPWREYRFSVRNVGGFTEDALARFSVPAQSTFAFRATFPFRRPTPISRISLSLAPYSTKPTSLKGWLRPFNGGAVGLQMVESANNDDSQKIDLELTEAVALDRMTPIEILIDLSESVERMDLVTRFSGTWGDGGPLLGPHLVEVFALPRFDAS